MGGKVKTEGKRDWKRGGKGDKEGSPKDKEEGNAKESSDRKEIQRVDKGDKEEKDGHRRKDRGPRQDRSGKGGDTAATRTKNGVSAAAGASGGSKLKGQEKLPCAGSSGKPRSNREGGANRQDKESKIN